MGAPTFQNLLSKHVLIIGGSSGIGFGVAAASLAAGARVSISSSSHPKVQSKVSQLKEWFPKSEVEGFAADLNKPTLQRDLHDLFEKVGKLDHIVFTACDPLELVPWQDLTLQQYSKSGQMRLYAQFFVAQVGQRYLNPGPESSITFTSGTSSEKPTAGWAMVASFAAGLKGLTRNLAIDLKPIRVNCVSPGYVATELWGGMDAGTREGIFDSLKKTLPTGAVGRPEQVAEAYLWLMKDSNVTGTCAETNGGMKL